jgi:hypothetical protein
MESPVWRQPLEIILKPKEGVRDPVEEVLLAMAAVAAIGAGMPLTVASVETDRIRPLTMVLPPLVLARLAVAGAVASIVPMWKWAVRRAVPFPAVA